MVLSYSAAARPGAEITSETTQATSSSSQNAGTPISLPASSSRPSLITHLILDAGPLLSLTPLRHLATSFHTTPMVLAELRDPKAREHWERLGLSGVDVRVEPPSAEAMSKVTTFAKKTGDYAVLSQTDLSVIALTYQYEAAVNGEARIRTEPGQKLPPQDDDVQTHSRNEGGEEGQAGSGSEEEEDMEDVDDVEDVSQEASVDGAIDETTQSIEQVLLDPRSSTHSTATNGDPPISPVPQDGAPPVSALPGPEQQAEDEESDGGEWITPSNLSSHRNHDLGLLPSDTGSKNGAPVVPLAAACMTGDFAVQNVLLGMGLGLVGEGGKRIGKVKSWVLRCHACFKICRDSSKRFCPSCGNPSLLRTTVTTSAKTGEQKIHLKKNFQYHLRGTKFSIPDAKPGRAKGQLKGGTGLILREDQAEWMDAVKFQERRQEKEERKMAKGAFNGWNDPDWLPEIITVGMSGKGRSGAQGMPAIGHGRRNPNQARRKR